METDISKLKYIDENQNEYFIGGLSDYNNERYGMMVNLHNPIDIFIAKIINNHDSIELELVEDENLAAIIINDIIVIN